MPKAFNWSMRTIALALKQYRETPEKKRRARKDYQVTATCSRGGFRIFAVYHKKLDKATGLVAYSKNEALANRICDLLNKEGVCHG